MNHTTFSVRHPLSLIAAFASMALTVSLCAQSALQQQHEADLAKAEQTLATLAAAPTYATKANAASAAAAAKANADKATALKEKANALDSLGRSEEALSLMQEAAQLAPNDFSIMMHTGVTLDILGRHDDAKIKYDTLFAKLDEWREEKGLALKSGARPKPTSEDTAILAVAMALPEYAAINAVYREDFDQALAAFTKIYEMRVRAFGPDDTTDYAVSWRLCLTARKYGDSSATQRASLDLLIRQLKLSTPYHQALVKFYQGKEKWAKVLAAIDSMKIDAAEKEKLRTEAHFFAAGYLRYVKYDNPSALALLEAENARPFNGLVERLFIRNELATLKAAPAN